MRLLLTAALVATIPMRQSAAQALMIAPNAIVIDARTNTGAVTLINTGDRAAEVSLSTLYGIPVSDSSGSMRLHTVDVIDDTIPSAAAWLRAFPERLVIAPGARRTVRLLASPPAGLPDREYWARLVVSSRAAWQTDSVTHDDASAVHVGLDLEVRSILGVFYRNGKVTTGVELSAARTVVDGDSLVTRVRMQRRGNAAFVGSLRAVLRDSDGVTRATALLPLGVYYTLEPRITIPRAGVPAGRYSIELEAVSSRPDVAPGLLLPATSPRLTSDVVLPASVASTRASHP